MLDGDKKPPKRKARAAAAAQASQPRNRKLVERVPLEARTAVSDALRLQGGAAAAYTSRAGRVVQRRTIADM